MRKRTYKTSRSGFTLIELMIVVVIIGILAAVGYPAYTKYARQTGRTDAVIGLTQLASDLEKFYSECSAYTAAITGAARSCTTPAGGTLGRTGALSPSGYYTLAITVAGGGYTLTATPVAGGKQAADSVDCSQFSLTSVGNKSATGLTAGQCWKK